MSNDAYSESLSFKKSTNDGHSKAWVVDVGVSRNDDDIARIPSERLHLLAGGWELLCGAEAVSPILSIGKKITDGIHGGLSELASLALLVSSEEIASGQGVEG